MTGVNAIRHVKGVSTVPGANSGPENVSFLPFPSKGLKAEGKNEGVPLAFGDRDQEAPVGAPPFGCGPQPGCQTSAFPPSNHSPGSADSLCIAVSAGPG